MQQEESFKEDQQGMPKDELYSPVIMLRSELAQEIISRRAGFVENWALPIFLVILLLIFGGSWFVHYPDTITTRVTITAKNSPIQIVTQKDGLINKLVVRDGQTVKKNDIICWVDSTYKLLAPIDGKIAFLGTTQQNRYLSKGSLIGHVIPENNEFYAETTISQSNLGKVDTGMLVQLKLDAYPYQDWGMLTGKISYISSVIGRAGILITVKLDANSITSDHKKIDLRDGLNAEAIIVTKDVRLFKKFYHGFISSTSLDK